MVDLCVCCFPLRVFPDKCEEVDGIGKSTWMLISCASHIYAEHPSHLQNISIQMAFIQLYHCICVYIAYCAYLSFDLIHHGGEFMCARMRIALQFPQTYTRILLFWHSTKSESVFSSHLWIHQKKIKNISFSTYLMVKILFKDFETERTNDR